MKNDIGWENFEKTGKVEDYLKFRGIDVNKFFKEEVAEEKGIAYGVITNNRDCN